MSVTSNFDIVTELNQQLGWPESFAHGARREYFRWLQLKQWAKDTDTAALAPSSTIEMVWRAHREWTVDYAITCNDMGGFVHHFPAEMRNPVRRKAAYKCTVESYKALFQEEPSEEFWEPFGAPSNSATAIATASADIVGTDFCAEEVMNPADHALSSDHLPTLLDEVVDMNSGVPRGDDDITGGNSKQGSSGYAKDLAIRTGSGLGSAESAVANLSSSNFPDQNAAPYALDNPNSTSEVRPQQHSYGLSQDIAFIEGDAMSIPGPEAISIRRGQTTSNSSRRGPSLGSSFGSRRGALTLTRHVGGGIIPTRRGRGRPRKRSIEAERNASSSVSAAVSSGMPSNQSSGPITSSSSVHDLISSQGTVAEGLVGIKRGRGRPRKNEDPSLRAAQIARKATRMNGLVLRPLTPGEKRSRGRPRFTDYVKIDELNPEDREEILRRNGLWLQSSTNSPPGASGTVCMDVTTGDGVSATTGQPKQSIAYHASSPAPNFSSNEFSPVNAVTAATARNAWSGNGRSSSNEPDAQVSSVQQGLDHQDAGGSWPRKRPKASVEASSEAQALSSVDKSASMGDTGNGAEDSRDVVSDATVSSPPTTATAMEGPMS